MRGARTAQAHRAHVTVHHHPVAPPRAIYGIKFSEFLARAASLRRRPGYSSSRPSAQWRARKRIGGGRGGRERESDIIDVSALVRLLHVSRWRAERASTIPTKAVVGTDGVRDGDEKRRREEASSLEKGRSGNRTVLRRTSRGRRCLEAERRDGRQQR